MRQHSRLPFRPIFRMKASNPSNDRLIGYVGDVSEGGLRLLSDQPIAVGQQLELRLRVRDRDGQLHQVDVALLCQWSAENPQTGYHEAGMALERSSAAYNALLRGLRATRKAREEDEQAASQRGETGRDMGA